jgi:branched-chain amino acid transport system substrate-binding protein
MKTWEEFMKRQSSFSGGGARHQITRRKVLGGLATLGMASAVGAVAGPAGALAQPTSALKYGAVIPKTGPYAAYGKFVETGLNAALKQINDSGGILNRQVQLFIRDDASDAGRALLAAKDLVEGENVDLLLPEIVSGLALAVLPYATSKKLITVTGAVAPKIGDPSAFPYSFQCAAGSADAIYPAMATAMKKLGGKRVGILMSTNPSMTALTEGLVKNLEPKFGIEVVESLTFTADTHDLTPQIQRLKDAGADIVAFSSPARENIRVMMTGIQTLGWDVDVVSEVSPLSGDLTTLIPPPVQSKFFAVNYRVGTRSAAPSAGLEKFIAALREQGPIENLAVSVLTREAVFIAKWGYETAQHEAGNTDPATVKKVLESLNTRSDYPTNYSYTVGNPRYTPTDHSTKNADFRNLWGLIRTSAPIDGRYEGEDLTVDYKT